MILTTFYICNSFTDFLYDYCIAVSLFSTWLVSSVSNCSKVRVFCCSEGLGICLKFFNKGTSDWIGNWGISFGVLGVFEQNHYLFYLTWFLGYFLFLFDQSYLDTKSPFGVFLFTSTFSVIRCDVESVSLSLSKFVATVLDKKSKKKKKGLYLGVSLLQAIYLYCPRSWFWYHCLDRCFFLW